MAEINSISLLGDASLVSYYHFNASSSVDNKDGNNGTDTTITYNAGNGKYEVGAGFGGASKISLGTGTNLNPVAITMAAWVKATSFTNALNTIVARSTDVNGSKYCGLFVKSNGKLACYVFATADVSYDGTGSNTLVTGTWYHIALTYSSTDGLRGYVNGIQDGSAAANGTIATITGTSYIGEDVFYTPRFWNGAIDDVAVFSRVLTLGEIETLYKDTAAGHFQFM